jgi:AcrR family transcriptional regulator
MAASSDPAQRGRPRNPGVDAPILRAAFRMLVDVGYAAMSIEAVAAEAGVGKTTVYRRYPSKRDLVIAALQTLTTTAPGPASADIRTAIEAFVRQSLGAPAGASGVRVMSALLMEARRDPELLEVFRLRVLEPRRETLVNVLQAGVERREIREDADPDVTFEIVAGSLIARHVLGSPVTDAWIASVTDAVWRSIASDRGHADQA